MKFKRFIVNVLCLWTTVSVFSYSDFSAPLESKWPEDTGNLILYEDNLNMYLNFNLNTKYENTSYFASAGGNYNTEEFIFRRVLPAFYQSEVR